MKLLGTRTGAIPFNLSAIAESLASAALIFERLSAKPAEHFAAKCRKERRLNIFGLGVEQQENCLTSPLTIDFEMISRSGCWVSRTSVEARLNS